MIRSPSTLSTSLLALLLSTATTAMASPTVERRVDSQVRRALATGVVSPHSLRMGPLKPGQTPVLLDLNQPPTPAVLADLQARGARLRHADGRPLHYDRFVPVLIDEASLPSLLASPHVQRVRSSPASSLLRPLDHSATLMDLDGARGARPALDLLTGHGIVIADLDSNADVFHPQFFHADAGWFDWIDVDGDGVFTPGIDAVDLDRDGLASPKETAIWLKASTLSLFYGEEVAARSSTFDPAIDWIYLDENGNGQRDYGAAKGFDDSVPAFGEPIFVPDDVNRNGKLDVGERLVRLGTSKFRKVFVHIQYYAEVNHVYERGVDLSTHQNDFTGGIMGYSDAMHGTGVLSIVAGDVPLIGRRWVGVAPEADLLLGYEIAQDSAKSLTWALGEKPDVMLHEVAIWTGEPMDGSDAYSTMVDTSMEKDLVTHTCPTGNLGGSRKHANVSIKADSSVTADLEIPPIGATYVQTSLSFRGGSDVAIVLREPGGMAHSLTSGPAYGNLSTGAYKYVGKMTSSRGTAYWDMLLYTPPGQPNLSIPTGGWTLEVDNQGASDLVLDAYVMDEVSGWGEGVAWAPSIATDASTAGIPSISDHCIAVGAHTGHPMTPSEPWFNTPGAVGEVRYYSGRGPRIDGLQKPDLVSPDNPWSAAPNDKDFLGNVIPQGAVWPFGGTSGATPHVTGVTALMAQAGIRGLDARAALREGAISDGMTGPVPNHDYGWGRVNAALALGVSAGGSPPKATLLASATVVNPDVEITLEVSATDPDGDDDALEVKWDDGYDGSWDIPYGPIVPRKVSYSQVGRYPTKVRVRDVQGRIDEALIWIEVKEGLIEADAGADAEAGTDGGMNEGGSAPSGGDQAGSSEGGCGCRTPVGGRTGAPALAMLASLSLLFLRRRR